MAFLFSRTKTDGNYDAVRKLTDSIAALNTPQIAPTVRPIPAAKEEQSSLQAPESRSSNEAPFSTQGDDPRVLWYIACLY